MYWDLSRNISNTIGETIGNISQTIGNVVGNTMTIFTDVSDFLGREYYFHVVVRMTTCFFFRNRPPEELDNKRSSTRRGEFDSSTPEAIGVLLGQIFLA